MFNVKVHFEYDGTNFHGFQKQNNYRTIQGEIENVLEKIFKEKIVIIASGRTDRGVHAFDQVINFEIKNKIEAQNLKKAFNTYLPKDIRCRRVSYVDKDFHARYSALKKEYIYYLKLGEASVFEKNYVTSIKREIKIEKIKEASNYFVGRNNFYNFCTNEANSVHTYVRTVHNINVRQENDLLIITIVGDGFLRNMIRMIVATLIKIGEEKIEKDYILTRLKDEHLRTNFKLSGNGLYLKKVYYDKTYK